MSHHSDEILPASDSFWEPGNYKRTTKRTEDGQRLCNDLVSLIKERAQIEEQYAKFLKTWSKKWAEAVDKGPEYGTTASAWKGILAEADKKCDLHNAIKDKLNGECVNDIKNWQKDHYHKTLVHLREKKEFDDAFKKAQKPWAKLLAKVNKSKADYHAACKYERSTNNQERNASGDTSISPDQVKKLQERSQKARDEVVKTKDKYENALKELNELNPRYMEDMKTVFDKCQDFEEKRLMFIKDALFKVHGALDISNSETHRKIYEEYRHTIQSADASKDLRYWSNSFGVDMNMNWPIFEEYCEEFREIVKKKNGTSENGIMLVNQQKFNEELPEYNHELAQMAKNKRNFFPNGNGVPIEESNGVIGTAIRQESHNGRIEHPNDHQRRQGDSNGNDDDEWDYDGDEDVMVDTGSPGVPVRALYDYVGTEDDELTFKQGDEFEKLSDEDAQGWCKGRKDGRVGLYPANYIEVITAS